jgi:hypothetical protein
MKPCELCKADVDTRELISYYDLCDVGLALGNSISLPLAETDMSKVIPGCTGVPDPEARAHSRDGVFIT